MYKALKNVCKLLKAPLTRSVCVLEKNKGVRRCSWLKAWCSSKVFCSWTQPLSFPRQLLISKAAPSRKASPTFLPGLG